MEGMEWLEKVKAGDEVYVRTHGFGESGIRCHTVSHVTPTQIAVVTGKRDSGEPIVIKFKKCNGCEVIKDSYYRDILLEPTDAVIEEYYVEKGNIKLKHMLGTMPVPKTSEGLIRMIQDLEAISNKYREEANA